MINGQFSKYDFQRVRSAAWAGAARAWVKVLPAFGCWGKEIERRRSVRCISMVERGWRVFLIVDVNSGCREASCCARWDGALWLSVQGRTYVKLTGRVFCEVLLSRLGGAVSYLSGRHVFMKPLYHVGRQLPNRAFSTPSTVRRLFLTGSHVTARLVTMAVGNWASLGLPRRCFTLPSPVHGPTRPSAPCGR